MSPFLATLIGSLAIGVVLFLIAVLPELKKTKRFGFNSQMALVAWVLITAAFLICPFTRRDYLATMTDCGDTRAFISIAMQVVALIFVWIAVKFKD